MADEAVATTQPAESSPAPITIPKDPEAYAEWRMNSGRNPDSEPTKAEAEDSGKPKPEASAASHSEPAASEAEKKSQEKPRPRRSNEGDRVNEFLDDIRALGLKPNDLKLSREELFQRLSPPPQPKAAPEKTEQPAAAPAEAPGLKPPKKPEFKDFNGDWDAYDAARDKYFEEMADYKAKAAVQADRIERMREAQQATFRQKLDEAKARYGAEADQTIIKTAQQIDRDAKIHPAVKALLDDSPVLGDLLYAMASDPDEFSSFLTEARERPGLAIRRAVLLEKLVQEELAKQSPGERKRDDNGQFVAAEKPPAKKTTAAPAPPSEVSGHGSPPEDEAERATRTNDFRAFRAIDNRKALARQRGS